VKWYWLTAVASAALLVLALLRFYPGEALFPESPLAQLPFSVQRLSDLPPVIYREEALWNQVKSPSQVQDEVQEEELSAQVARTPGDSEMASDGETRRVVLNFRLPRSGVRMIWIQDSRFGMQEGDTDED
jgi:hypothetical protein